MAEKEAPLQPNPHDGMRLSDVLSHLRSGQLPRREEGYHVLYINSTPSLRGEMFISPSGNPEYSFGQKFEPDFRGWETGDRVRSRYLVQRREQEDGTHQVELLVADSVVEDSRHADIFALEGLSPEDKAALQGIGLAELAASVQVIGKDERFRLSNMHKYRARLDRVIGVQKPWDGDPNTLHLGNPVLVEGQVLAYIPGTQYSPGDAHITIALASGQAVPVTLKNGSLTIADGTLDIAAPGHPVAGDIVQVNAVFGNPGERYGREEQPYLFADDARSTFLLQPQPERAEAYQAQRQRVQDAFLGMAQMDDPAAIRHAFGSLVASSVLEGVRLNITRAERQRANDLIAQLIPDAAERPMALFDDVQAAEAVRNDYGIDIYALSPQEYFAFCGDVARGERPMRPDAQVSAPYRLMRHVLPETQQEAVYHTAIKRLYARVVGKELLVKKDILADPKDVPDTVTPRGWRNGKVIIGKADYDPQAVASPDNMTWEEYHLFERSIQLLKRHISRDTARLYLDLARNMQEHTLFWRGAERENKEFFELEILGALADNISENIQWQDKRQGTQIVGLHNEAAAQEYLAQRPMLEALRDKMKTEGWKKEGARRPEADVKKALASIHLISTFFQQKNAPLN